MVNLLHNKRTWTIIFTVIVAISSVFILFDIGRLVLALSRDASIDAVKIRNALIADVGTPNDVSWTPDSIPANYNWENRAAPAEFVGIVEGILPAAVDELSQFEIAIHLARHLHQAARPGQPIQANTWETYNKIITGQGGYCSDFTQAFNALALAAGLKVREWGFTWQTLANGHAFNEVWEPNLGKWVLIDSHHGFYPVDRSTGNPITALEFRSHLMDLGGPARVELIPLTEKQFTSERVQYERTYYARGMPRMFMLMGNNVFSYDANPLIRFTEALPRSIEFMTAILIGEHPRFLFVPPEKRPKILEDVRSLAWTRVSTFLKLGFLALVSVVAFIGIWRRMRRPTNDRLRNGSTIGNEKGSTATNS